MLYKPHALHDCKSLEEYPRFFGKAPQIRLRFLTNLASSFFIFQILFSLPDNILQSGQFLGSCY